MSETEKIGEKTNSETCGGMITVHPLKCKSTAVGYNTGNYAKAEKNTFVGYGVGWETKTSNNVLIGVELNSNKDNQIKIGKNQVNVQVGVYNLEEMWKYIRELEERIQALESEKSRNLNIGNNQPHFNPNDDPLNTNPV